MSAHIIEDGHTKLWDREIFWTYDSGAVTLPQQGKRAGAKRIQKHGPLGKKMVVTTISKVGSKPILPKAEPDTKDQWLEKIETRAKGVIPNSQGEPEYFIQVTYFYGLADAERARGALEMGSPPFVRADYPTAISEGDYRPER